MAEGARLESACTGNRTGGSNPPLSAQLRQAPAPLPGRGFFMAPAIELVPVSQGAIKTQRCAKGAPRALDEIEVTPKGNAPALRARRNRSKGNAPVLRARRNPLGNAPALRARRNPLGNPPPALHAGAIPRIKNPRLPELLQHVTAPGNILWLPSQLGIFWLCPQTQSFMPFLRRMRVVYFSIRADTVADCFAAVKNIK